MLYVLSDYSPACLRKNLAIVSVAFPATPFLLSRVRFCISAAHTKEDLDEALRTIKELSEEYRIRYSSHICG
ncbi:Serine palmitoyltransferase 2 [Phytophthora citrophthora]|uniref:Serine palmitoyltransferase 2 n=1 Tax=Phytophthora citrophthora TaxID=4793 RepID=A0AAD9GMQ1_9STRA|nr:Serine palmitoyltransferase 2 [Phytophthora citrophthora]